jgi:CHASE3 domain sensor protein
MGKKSEEYEQLKDKIDAIVKDVENLTVDSTGAEIEAVQRRLNIEYKGLQEAIDVEEDEGLGSLLDDLSQALEDADSELHDLEEEKDDWEEPDEDDEGDPDADDKDGPDA